jgi:hypothetical protein
MATTFSVPSLRDVWRRAALVSLAVVVCAGVVVALVRAGGTRSDGTDAASSSSGALKRVATTIAPSAAYDSDASGGATAAAAPEASTAAGDTAVAATGPSIVRTADLQVRVKRGSFAGAVERATSIAAGAGGFVTSSSTSSYAKGEASGELTVRVPSARFDDVRRSLAKLGTLEAAETGGQDVGGQLVDLDARLRTLRAEEGSLDVLLGDARDIGQILQIRDRLTGVRTQIEQLAGQQAALQGQVDLATIHVSLHEAGAAAVHGADGEGGTSFGDSVGTAVDALVAVVGGMVIVLGVAVPFLVLALLALPFVLRRRRRATASA